VLTRRFFLVLGGRSASSVTAVNKIAEVGPERDPGRPYDGPTAMDGPSALLYGVPVMGFRLAVAC